ncbi:hypothetical protein FACS189440_12260 [Bacteroidia bacterium]|nr:hypothetical protein FACS189440_12260 [Bacteroidia bacterium]
MFIMFGFLALEFLVFGFALDKLLLEAGTYTYAIDVFNSIVLYFFVADFVMKFFFKQNQSMQIAPYLTLPVKRNRLFDFLLIKEFSSFWNFYYLFLVVPFAFKSITPYFGLGTAFLYILFFYLVCVGISLLVNLINHLISKSFWFYILPVVLVVVPIAIPLMTTIPLSDYTQQAGELILNDNPLIWLILLLVLVALWFANRIQMRSAIYNELQGEKADKVSSFSNLSFLDRFGATGDFINLEIKMIFRSTRLKQQTLVVSIICIAGLLWMLYGAGEIAGAFNLVLYEILTIGMLGIVMGQYIFTAESSFFDGLMSRKLSMYELLKGKYILYSAYSLFVTLLLLVPVFHGKLELLLLLSLFFYVIGPIYFMIFQNAVYNKTYFDLFDKGMMNWKGQSGNMVVITMITMFLPVILVLILYGIIGKTPTYWFMLITGLAFTLSSQYWLKWIYKRFLKRKYKNMEGFRSNA